MCSMNIKKSHTVGPRLEYNFNTHTKFLQKPNLIIEILNLKILSNFF